MTILLCCKCRQSTLFVVKFSICNGVVYQSKYILISYCPHHTLVNFNCCDSERGLSSHLPSNTCVEWRRCILIISKISRVIVCNCDPRVFTNNALIPASEDIKHLMLLLQGYFLHDRTFLSCSLSFINAFTPPPSPQPHSSLLLTTHHHNNSDQQI